MKVLVRNNDVEKALSRLKKKLNNDGHFKKLQEKEFFIKPSERRRKKKREAIAKHRKESKMREMSRY